MPPLSIPTRVTSEEVIFFFSSSAMAEIFVFNSSSVTIFLTFIVPFLFVIVFATAMARRLGRISKRAVPIYLNHRTVVRKEQELFPRAEYFSLPGPHPPGIHEEGSTDVDVAGKSLALLPVQEDLNALKGGKIVENRVNDRVNRKYLLGAAAVDLI